MALTGRKTASRSLHLMREPKPLPPSVTRSASRTSMMSWPQNSQLGAKKTYASSHRSSDYSTKRRKVKGAAGLLWKTNGIQDHFEVALLFRTWNELQLFLSIS